MYKNNRVRKLNDLFRTTFDPSLGEVFVTSGVASLEDAAQATLMRRVVNATHFDEQDGSRGFFREDRVDYIWQMEVLDREDHEYASDAPWLKKKSWRRMTIMRGDEW
ncbi:DUF3768 domain-containing protein [Rhizobium leguminosarum]|uniref:DUF3768 domain-containing protein n=1 Tax=Rhizobium leguminosarum TaxID=384 RepID=UPI001C95F818|nr:DUF3768 domain-containing protein [Rhizobium leguminosarum]MBY5407407.1 DUF3768 domain-containing protein [Rhizobium leguminosarum]